MSQYYRILSLTLEHVDVLALLYFIRYIVDRRLNLFYFVLIAAISTLFFLLVIWLHYFSAVFLDTVFQRQIFVADILKEDGILHLIAEFLVFEASEFDERADAVPVFLIILSLCLTHSGQFIRYFLGDIVRNLIDKSIILQRASGYVQRKVRAVDDSL